LNQVLFYDAIWQQQISAWAYNQSACWEHFHLWFDGLFYGDIKLREKKGFQRFKTFFPQTKKTSLTWRRSSNSGNFMSVKSFVRIERFVFKKMKALGSISSTFYEQLLHAQIPKTQKDSQVVSLLWTFGSAHVKAHRTTLMKVHNTCYYRSYI